MESSLELQVCKILKKVAKEKVREYIIGNVVVEVVDGNMVKINGAKTNIRGLEEKILNNMVN